MFKDNIVIISGLLSYIILNKTNLLLIQSGVIAATIGLISAVRPFMGMFFPLALLPLWTNINNKKIKKSLFIVGCIIIVLIFISFKDYIAGIQNAFNDDSSVQAGRSSPPVALIKVFLGPTPLHYLFHEKYMVQPFLDSQAIIYTILHIIYYGMVAFWLIYLLYNWRDICNIYKMTISRIFILALAFIQLVVYVLIYGSADIRQRAIIISFFYIFTLIDSHKIIIQKMSRNKFVILIISLSLLLLLSFIS